MIDTEQTVRIAAPIGQVWDFVRDIRRWASLMPGLRECDVIDDDNSRWVLKVGVGGLVRTVTVDVHVESWDGPGHVTFQYQLQGDPVQGGGTYTATAIAPGETEVVLNVQVVGSGPLAPMWEAMGRPLLPQLAKGFAGQLREAIEAHVAETGGAAPQAAPRKGFLAWLRRLWQALTGHGSS